MELTASFFMVAIPAILIAGIAKGGFGGGGVFLATPLLATIVEPRLAVSLLLPLLVLMDAATVRSYWNKWDWPNAKGLMLGGIGGVVLGTIVFEFANPDALRFLIGAIAVAFVLFQLARAQGWISISRTTYALGPTMGFGAVAGFTSFVSHAGSPPVLIHLLRQEIDKTAFQATTVIVFAFVNLIKLPPYYFLGLFTREAMIAVAALAPAALIGALIGVWSHSRIPQRVFFGFVYVLLFTAGLKLMISAVI